MRHLRRAIGLREAVAVNVITMIGIGPLVTIPLVLAALGGPLALVGWIAGAVVALCDGLVWAELSSQYPGSGGTYVYLRNTFGEERMGRALAFLFNWQFLLYAPCLLASGYIGFANYAAYLYPPLGTNVAAHDTVAVAIGIITIALLYRRTSNVAALGTLLAVAAALTVALIAFAALTHAHFEQVFHLDAPIRLSAGLLAGFGSALYITLYDYVGYADVALLGDEVIRPTRTIPLAILLSVLVVAVLYVLLQIGVLGVVPWRSLLDASGAPTVQSQYVGSLVVEHTWGHWAAVGITLLVLITAFASLYGNLLGFSRIPFAAARDGAFLPAFARLHPRKDIPHVALLAVGALSLVASLFTLDQVIAFLTAGIVLVQGIAQIIALAALRNRGKRAPFRMPLYPLPAIVALLGWTLAFIYTGASAIAIGVGWLVVGIITFLIVARIRRWWPFALAILLLFCASAPAVRAGVIQDHGYPVFTVDGKPFFVYGAAFFYERIPRDQWRETLLAYKQLGINTIDLYLIWNWHEPSEGVRDFTGTTDPRRDLAGLLRLTHELGFKLILRPGPVIRNEWRNGGYPAWLLERPDYAMPLHDVLEGRYPATATLQNAHADSAAAEWLANTVHRRYAARWLRDVLGVAGPALPDVIAIALDDDQGAYIDNDTWPAPHWHAYIDWLRDTVRAIVGTRIPLFINTYEMKVTAASPAWAWGDWYQSDAYAIGAHDLAELDFATGLLQTQPHRPVMQAEFQAGWLQGADEALPRPSDPTNTALALNELLRNGAHGVINFPVQDTIYPAGWEAPWANWSYAWDAALTADLRPSPRYAPTAAFGDDVRRFGSLLARTHVAADAAIVWPPSLFRPSSLTNADFAAFEDATIAMQRQCSARRLACELVDLAYADDATLRRYHAIVLPIVLSPRLAASLDASMVKRLAALRAAGQLVRDLTSPRLRTPVVNALDTTLLLADDASFAFIDVVNPSTAARMVGPLRVSLAHRVVWVPAFSVSARSARLVPVAVRGAGAPPLLVSPASHRMMPARGLTLSGSRLRVVFAPNAGARVWSFGEVTGENVGTSIGLLRDAVDPEPSPSARDFIAAYTHPLPAGTFNRAYACQDVAGAPVRRVYCAYDAPDIPEGGGRFERWLSFDGNELVVSERFTPHDSKATARLESISGFAFADGDTLVAPNGAPFVGMLHGHRLTAVRWHSGDVAGVTMRRTRGAELITLVFAKPTAELRLGIFTASDVTEALRLLQANPP